MILIWSILFTTDLIQANRNQNPIFAYPAVIYQDGGSRECYGMGYKVNVYVSQEGAESFRQTTRVDVGTWLMPFRY